MILSFAISKLGLQKKIRSRHDARAIRRRQPFADSRFKVVSPLVGGIDSSKATSQR